MNTGAWDASMIALLDDDELLRYVDATGAGADLLVRRLADYADRLLREIQEEDRQIGASLDEEGPAMKQAREEGWQHGLEVAYSLVETEENALHETPDPDGMKKSAKKALDRVAKAIEAAQTSDSDEYIEPDELSDQPERHEARVLVQRHVAAAGREPSTPERIRQILQVGKIQSRKALIRMLKDEGIAASNISTAIARMVATGELFYIDEKRYLKRAR